MAAKITALLMTLLINIGIGVAVFLFMLVAMNGFHESDAMWGLVTYMVLAAAISIAMASGAYLLTRYLLRKEFNGAVAALIAVPIFSVVGGALEMACCIIGILIAEYVRVNF